jgi:anti-anti-sigma regulatory factor
MDGQTALIFMGSTSYGSSERQKLKELEDLMMGYLQREEVKRLYLDLSDASSYGAGLLGVLVQVAVSCRPRDQALIVSRDRFRLMELTCLDRWIEVRNSL